MSKIKLTWPPWICWQRLYLPAPDHRYNLGTEHRTHFHGSSLRKGNASYSWNAPECGHRNIQRRCSAGRSVNGARVDGMWNRDMTWPVGDQLVFSRNTDICDFFLFSFLCQMFDLYFIIISLMPNNWLALVLSICRCKNTLEEVKHGTCMFLI